MNFDDHDLLAELEAATDDAIGAADFGVIGMNVDGVVEVYNRFESQLSGLSSSRVLGFHFFTAVAPCTNNYMVAQRFADEPMLDEMIDYVFTLKMRPTKVKLRLLRSPSARRQYLIVRRS